MIGLKIILGSDGCWKDLEGKLGTEQVVELRGEGEVARIANGCQSGEAALALRLQLPDGRVVIWYTTERLWTTAAKAFEGRSQFEKEAGDATSSS